MARRLFERDITHLPTDRGPDCKINIFWTHIGDGCLRKKISAYAQLKLSPLQSISYKFLGAIENKKVYKFYKENPVDVFINVSSSEGVPVSIMEAMSCSIPIIAPDTGGIRDMVIDGQNGILLNSEPSPEIVYNAISRYDLFKLDEIE